MKKKLAVLFSMVLVLAVFAGCKGGKDNTSLEISVKPLNTSTASTSEPKPEPEPEPEPEIVIPTREVVTLGTYEQDNDNSNGREPIEWIVLDKQADKMLVVSRYILDCKPMVNGFGDADWGSSDLRKWLNNEFYTFAFNENDRTRIIESFVPDTEYVEPEPVKDELGNVLYVPEVERTGSNDKVFLLSDFELKQYFENSEELLLDEPYAKATSYATAQGVWTLSSENYSLLGYEAKGIDKSVIGAGWWWLRTPAYEAGKTRDVDVIGEIRMNGHDNGECHDGVRPALWISLQ